ncbi:hypothetical protein GUJ93_ZPchr0013g37140 [Zizania palustris]|uniref:Uncharacterized protein n=1 Tax=Zizania palustris TaxID=103762 RepID=A0A8J5X5H1_ZIZPA|nr:hypothetical protein GUJ93_ZPchr0013g37140 [Zizania palustris]
MPQLKLVKDITPHTATQKPATNLENAIQQKKRKANIATAESPVARHRLNTNDMSTSLLVRSLESSIPRRFSKAVLMDNLRSLAKLHLVDELSGTRAPRRQKALGATPAPRGGRLGGQGA